MEEQLGGRDSFIDATNGRSVPISAGLGVLYQMGGLERISRNRETVPQVTDQSARRELNAVRAELYNEREDAFKYYPSLLERLKAVVQQHGRTLPSDIDLLVIRSIMGEPMAELAREGEALIADLGRRADSGDVTGFAVTSEPLTETHFRRHQGIAHNNVAHYWRSAGDVERALFHQQASVAILNRTGGLGLIPAIDRRYALAALLMESALVAYEEAVRLDQTLSAEYPGEEGRFSASLLEYPVLENIRSLGERDPWEVPQ